MSTRVKRPSSPSFKIADLISWMHDASKLVATLDRCNQLLWSSDLEPATRQRVHEAAAGAVGMLKEMLPNPSGRRRRGPRSEVFDLNTLAASCIDVLQPEAQAAGVTLRFFPTPQPALVAGDRASLKRVVYNLVINGMEATAQGGQVTLSTRREKGKIALVVTDSGSGMSASTRRRLFRAPFTTKRNGSGHGLIASAAAIARLGGTLALESKARSRTTVTIMLPAGSRPRKTARG